MIVELQFEVAHQLASVLPFLTDMPTFVSVHPLIYKAEHLSSNQYLIYEKIKTGPLTYHFTYPAWVETNTELNEVRMRAVIKQMVQVEMIFKLSSSSHGTLIKEHVKFKTMLPIKRLLKHIFRKQHTELFHTIGIKLTGKA